MKTFTKFFLLFVLLAVLAMPAGALAAPQPGGALSVQPDQFVFGDNYTLDSGSTLSGNLWIFGGNAELRSGSQVNGDVLLFGGNLRASGEINGNVQAAGGNVHLRSTAVVRGDVNMLGGNLSRDNNARIEGSVNDNNTVPFRFPGPGVVPVVPPSVNIANPFVEFLGFLFQSFLTAALAVLVALFIPAHTERVARTVMVQPVIAGGLGLITVVVAPIVMIIMMITLILIPVSLILGLLLGLAVLFGWIAVGTELGKRMARLFKTEWSLPLAAGIGTLTLSLVIGGAGKYVWCVGWLLPTLVALAGLGAVLLTRFGTQNYPIHGYPPVVTPAPGPVPVPYPAASPVQTPAAVYPVSDDAPGSQWQRTDPAEDLYPSAGGAQAYPPYDDEVPPAEDRP